MLSTTSARLRLVRDRGQPGDVGDAEQRVGRRLAPHDAGVGPDRRAHGVEVAERHGGVLEAPVRQHLCDQPERAAVRVAGQDQVVARAGTPPAAGCPRTARPLANAKPAGPALERGQRGLQRGARGVGAAAVLVALAQPADAVLLVRRGRVDRDGHRPGARVGLLPGVDGQRVEACHPSDATHRAPPSCPRVAGPGPRHARSTAGLPHELSARRRARATPRADNCGASGAGEMRPAGPGG